MPNRGDREGEADVGRVGQAKAVVGGTIRTEYKVRYHERRV